MAWPPLLQQIELSESAGCPAELSGYDLLSVAGRCFPRVQSGGGIVRGLLFESPGRDVAKRIGYLAAGLGYEAVTGELRAGDQLQPATIYRSVPGAGTSDPVWQEGAWQEKWGRIAGFAVEEVLQHFGLIPAETLQKMMPMIEVRAASRVAAGKAVPTDVRSDMGAACVEIQERHNRHAGFFLTREYTLRHPQFGGGMSAEVKREVFVATDAAIVLPYDPVRDRVLLVEQFRMGPFGRGDPLPWMLEPVAGRVDPGETPEATACRECAEEAGLALERLEHIASHYCSPGCSSEYFHCYLGLCDLPDLSTGQGGLDSEDEDIRTHILPFEQALALIPSGEAANGPLILSLLWLQRERQRLRAGA